MPFCLKECQYSSKYVARLEAMSNKMDLSACNTPKGTTKMKLNNHAKDVVLHIAAVSILTLSFSDVVLFVWDFHLQTHCCPKMCIYLIKSQLNGYWKILYIVGKYTPISHDIMSTDR